MRRGRTAPGRCGGRWKTPPLPYPITGRNEDRSCEAYVSESTKMHPDLTSRDQIIFVLDYKVGSRRGRGRVLAILTVCGEASAPLFFDSPAKSGEIGRAHV